MKFILLLMTILSLLGCSYSREHSSFYGKEYYRYGYESED